MPTLQKNHLGPNPIIEVYKRDVDVSLIRENMKLSPHERLEKLVQLQQFAAELQRAGQSEQVQPEQVQP